MEAIDFAELRQTGALPSPQGIGLTVMQMCQDEKVSLDALARIIRTDPAMSGHFIKLANSAAMGSTQPVAAITKDVLLRIGVGAVRQAALALSLASAQYRRTCENFDYDAFWSRSLAMACASQALSAHVRVASSAELFTCGLLAGIGRLGLAVARPQAYSLLLLQYRGQSPEELVEAETSIFGLNHRTLMAVMLEDWAVPKFFVDALLCHENPQNSHFIPGSRSYKLGMLFRLASILADLHCTPDNHTGFIGMQASVIGNELDISDEQLALASLDVRRQYPEWAELLEIPQLRDAARSSSGA